MANGSAGLRSGPMTDAVLADIYASDQDMYPAPLTLSRLRSWVAAAPELCRCFYLPDGSLAGSIIVLSLVGEWWEKLLCGQVREGDIEPEVMFPSQVVGGSISVGLHVFHVERSRTTVGGGFARGALRGVLRSAKGKGWDILGCSALTATTDGRKCFERLGFTATGYEEFWVRNGEKIELVPVFPGEIREKAVGGDANVVSTAQMVVLHDLTSLS